MRREDYPFKAGDRSLIKIEPLFAIDYVQARALLRFEPEPQLQEHLYNSRALLLRGLAFWQHWLPCQLHIAPSVYVAKEDGVLLGIIVLRSAGKSKLCWQVDQLIVHPHHRGRGIAQELLRYVFALFGSQGATHFISEISDNNSAALQLYGSCGFRRCSKVTYYQASIGCNSKQNENSDVGKAFRIAQPADRQALFMLHQEALPKDIRLIMNYCPEDFTISEFRLEKAEALRRRVMRKQGWYWVAEDCQRHVLTGAIKVYAHRTGDYHMDFAIHPGWSELTHELVSSCLDELNKIADGGQITARVFDYQTNVAEVLVDNKLERSGEFCFLAREHWMRAKKSAKQKIERQITLPSMPNPAINLPRLDHSQDLHWNDLSC